ncbi:MAG: hypothetical protein HKN76_12760 [Saprospiraceae bacterium]|nr:hypothetical protein [Saprospiraceae bacterium]
MAKQLFTLPVLFPDPIPLDPQVDQKLSLKFSDDLYYSRQPGNNRQVKFTVKTKLDAIFLIATNNDRSKKLRKDESDSLGRGRRGFLLAIPKLFFVNRDGNNRIYQFGQNGGQGNNDDATVQLSYSQADASPTQPSNRPPVTFDINEGEMMVVTNTSTESGNTDGKHFLKAEASPANPVTVTINRNPNQGKVIVCIFNANNGNLLARLDPKDQVDLSASQSFTSDKIIHIVPVIKPLKNSINGKDEIKFEVGDPKDNGSAESEEK